MAPTIATRRARLRAILSGASLAGHPSVRRFLDRCQTGLETLLRIGLTVAGARWTPWIALGLAAAFSMLPPRFAGQSLLMFEVGTQPPAAIVNGTAQLLASRELALDAVRRLSAEDMARLASPGLFTLAPTPTPSDDAKAAQNLRTSLHVEPVQGGRGLEITVSGPSPALAARAADAYVAAMIELDSAARAQASELHHMPLPPVRRDAPATGGMLPESPSPIALLLLALGAGTLLLVRRQRAPEPDVQGFVDPDDLPRELNHPPRLIWVDDGAQGGLPLATAIPRLRARLPACEGAAEHGRIILFTTDTDADATARSALAFSRLLAEGAGVVMVFLDDLPAVADACENHPGLPGLHDLLCGRADFVDAISRDPKSRAHVIRAGMASNPQFMSSHARHLCTLLDVLRQAYEEVVVLAPDLARLPERLTRLKPLTICVQGVDAPATVAVESCEILAARHFPSVTVLRLAPDDAENENDTDRLPVPSLDAAAQYRAALPALYPGHGPDWPFPELIRAA